MSSLNKNNAFLIHQYYYMSQQLICVFAVEFTCLGKPQCFIHSLVDGHFGHF